jgi:hypothetical protein
MGEMGMVIILAYFPIGAITVNRHFNRTACRYRCPKSRGKRIVDESPRSGPEGGSGRQ